MRIKLPFVWAGIVFIFIVAPGLRADLVEMQNGDRYLGRVSSVSADVVTLESEVLGKITLPRTNVANLTFTNTPALKPASASVPALTNPPTVPSRAELLKTDADLSAVLRNPGTNLNSIAQIREQMLASSPEAAGKFNELVTGLMSGKLTVEDIRHEAKSAADQLRELKRELGPDAAGSFDGYLDLLDHFLKETTPETKTNAPASPPKAASAH